MYRDRFSLACSAAVLATAVLGVPLGTGAPSDAAAAGPEQAASGVHGAVNVTIWSIYSDGPDFQAVPSGAIGDYGPP
jgi:hypothetical protein